MGRRQMRGSICADKSDNGKALPRPQCHISLDASRVFESGIEAATVVWRPLGWQAPAFAEIEKFPSAVLAHHYPDVPNVGDMTKHDWSQYRGKCDLVVGGPPCQAFSIAGLRQSLDDDRGNLSIQFAKAIHAIRPNWAVIENVPGWLSTKDNAFGCMLSALIGADAPLRSPCERGRWPDAGMVAGPEGRVVWRILDAQHFGLAQRRRRVFVAGGFRDWTDPAAILFERKSVRWNSAPGREARKSVAALTANGVGTCGADDNQWQAGHLIARSVAPSLTSNYAKQPDNSDTNPGPMLVAYGGGNMSGPIDVATAHGVRQDFGTETFLTHTLRADGFDASEDGTGRGIPLVTAFSCKDHGADAGETAPTLRAMGQAASHANAGGQLAVAFDMRGREGGSQFEGPHHTANIRTSSGGSSRSYVAQGVTIHGTDKTANAASMTEIAGSLRTKPPGSVENSSTTAALHGSAVRRLTPTECERLQGFKMDIPQSRFAANQPQMVRATKLWETARLYLAWLGLVREFN